MLLQIVKHDLEEDLVQKMVEDGFKGGFKWSLSFEVILNKVRLGLT